jgi:D-alanyl-D-alanine carboxypeptidase/D-alanyl-D-alanine-endopeptidase (penicillin-binding protein 4)
MQENKNRRIFSIPGRRVFLHRGARRGFIFAAAACRCFAFALLCLLTSSNSSTAADTAEAGAKKPLESLLSKNRYPLRKVFVALKDLDQDGDSMITQLNADSLVNPASVSKLLTAAIAFDKLGTGYTFKTSVYQDSAFDPATGACKGLVYIRGGGDPSLVIERLWLLVQHLACMGVTSVEKDIVLDDSFFDTVSCGPGFYEESADNPYMAPINALSVNFNCVSVWVRPGASMGAPVFSSLLPKSEIVGLSSFAKTAPGGKQTDCIISVKKAQDMTSVTVSGTLPRDNRQVLEYRKVWQTRDYFASVLRTLLKDNRIAFKGNFRHGTVPEPLRQQPPFYAFASPPLSDIITDMFKFSSNFAAEMIFKTLSAEKDATFGGTWEKSAALAVQWWKDKGLPAAGAATGAVVPKIRNGSGMGDSNRMSCRQIVELLSYVNMSKSFLPEYLYALPSAGVDGTLKSRFRNSRFKGIVRGKTGTLNDFGVHSIAGYILFPKKSYAFAIIFNGLTEHSQVNQWEMQEKILDLIVPGK